MSTTTHERDIPSLARHPTRPQAENCYTELSFCLPTSLAFFKRLSWEQTPWVPCTHNFSSSNPLTASDAHLIHTYLPPHLSETITPPALQNALLFGTTFPYNNSTSDEELGTYPHVFVVFPHATQHDKVVGDEAFLRIWHDDIVKPAFDRAWKDSGLVAILGAEKDGQTKILPPTGTRTHRDTRPASGFLARRRNKLNNGKMVRDWWPVWPSDYWGLGSEGKYTGVRSRMFSAAWEAICGMLRDHPQLPEYQEPVLLAVSRNRVYLSPHLSSRSKYQCVADEWDKLVDSRFVEPGSFKVVFQTVVGTVTEGVKQLERVQHVLLPSKDDAVGENSKRMATETVDEDENEDGHRDKRQRKMTVASDDDA
jgi:hypothetical protein